MTKIKMPTKNTARVRGLHFFTCFTLVSERHNTNRESETEIRLRNRNWHSMAIHSHSYKI